MMETIPETQRVRLDRRDRGGSYPGLDLDMEGGFFDDDMMPRGGRGDIRSHLDDLAHRHPEFAAQLRGPAWGSEMWAGDDDGAASSHASSTSEPRQDQEQSDEPGPLRGRPRNNLPQHGLRNTVPDMGQRQADELKEEARGQRSWSAPPDNRLPREQRFVSRISINPVNPDEGAGDATQQPPPTQASDNQGKPPPVPKQQQAQQQQPQQPKSASNVRHIPIFVEGRDEPIIPKNVDAETEPSYQQHFATQAQHQFHPQNKPFPQQKRPFQSPQSNPPQHKQPNRSFNTSPKPFQQPSMHSNFPPQQGSPFAQHHQQPQQQQPPQEQQTNVPMDSRPKTPEPPRPKVVNDPISKVQAIQKEIDALKGQVEQYSGNSRQDKEYVYLDEMLTRNLIKLDDIETDGKENIRVTRKEAIRSIQQCINILEGKVPLPAEQQQPMEESQEDSTGLPESSMASVESAVGEAPTVASEGVDDQVKSPTVDCVAVEASPMEVEEKPEAEQQARSADEEITNTTGQESTAEEKSATTTKTDEEKPKD